VRYYFARWDDGAGNVLSGSKTLYYGVQSDGTIHAVYGPRQYRLTVELKVSGARVPGATVEVTQFGHTYTPYGSS
jgi:hypothetical protein